MTVTRQQIVDTCDRYVAAVSAHDPDLIMATFGDHPHQEEPVGSEPNVGREAIRRFFESHSGGFTILRMSPVTVVGHHAVMQIRVDLERGGARKSLTSSDVMTFDDDGRITSIRAYPDPEADPDAELPR
jgi:steroid delta-isomerase